MKDSLNLEKFIRRHTAEKATSVISPSGTANRPVELVGEAGQRHTDFPMVAHQRDNPEHCNLADNDARRAIADRYFHSATRMNRATRSFRPFRPATPFNHYGGPRPIFRAHMGAPFQQPFQPQFQSMGPPSFHQQFQQPFGGHQLRQPTPQQEVCWRWNNGPSEYPCKHMHVCGYCRSTKHKAISCTRSSGGYPGGPPA
ncbi:hypothetical protein BV898_18641 [Hypsibius exemplaris]|uniref:Uncharacterized protein n=1 Tax=Hypsibius exemplaris TaxID=2072580 RepID=A0A9X6RNN7_HYPEX|nr:hypothetical protein BV898_18641 [Hypsibius exemplaris]